MQELGLPAIVLWPNADAGSEDIARGIRKFREHEDDARLHFFKNLPTDDYVQLMQKTSVPRRQLELGDPRGLVHRHAGGQHRLAPAGRQRGANVVDVGYDAGEIADAMRAQLEHGRYEHEPIYGDGHAGERIADILSRCEISLHKRMTY